MPEAPPLESGGMDDEPAPMPLLSLGVLLPEEPPED